MAAVNTGHYNSNKYMHKIHNKYDAYLYVNFQHSLIVVGLYY
jgi:hypothetical protein